jgi:hypothetical protein
MPYKFRQSSEVLLGLSGEWMGKIFHLATFIVSSTEAGSAKQWRFTAKSCTLRDGCPSIWAWLYLYVTTVAVSAQHTHTL